MTDFRKFEWIREKVSLGLDIQPELVDQLYEDPAAQSCIAAFLDGGEFLPFVSYCDCNLPFAAEGWISAVPPNTC
jgi:hypothetical protein